MKRCFFARRAVLAAWFSAILTLSPVTVPAAVASWYGAECEGKFRADGKRFCRSELVAAHRTLPLGTVVRVTNIATGARVVVVIRDRGPAAWTKRDIDLSEGAFSRIARLKQGLVNVRIELLP